MPTIGYHYWLEKLGNKVLRVTPDPDYESTSSANDDESENKGNEKGTQISKKMWIT